MRKDSLSRLSKAGLLKARNDGLVRLRMPGGLSRRAFGIGMAAASSLSLLAPGSARAATEVNFMGWQGYEEGLAADGFLEKNGLSLATTYMNDNNQLIATATNGGFGNMDLITPDHGYTPVMAAIGMLEPLDLARIPNFAGLFDEFRTMPGPNVDGVQYSLPYTWGSIPLMYNPEFVTEPPTSWLDILDPKYKGKVALTNDVISVIVPFTMAATGTKHPTRISKDELDACIDLIIRIKKEHARTIASGYGELADLFAAKEVVMAQSWEPVATWAGQKGANLKWVVPKEGTWTLIDCLAIVKDAPHRDENYLLLNHGLSAEAQSTVANANSTGVTAAGALPLLNERARSLYPYDDIGSFFASTGGGPFPLWPLDPEGDYVTFDDVLNGWERFLKA
jgi:spermidine/putrescine transport system substrate-binding protein